MLATPDARESASGIFNEPAQTQATARVARSARIAVRLAAKATVTASDNQQQTLKKCLSQCAFAPLLPTRRARAIQKAIVTHAPTAKVAPPRGRWCVLDLS